MEEYIDIVDEKGQPIGQTALKSVIHRKGYYHNTAHIWFYTKKGEVLLSQRSSKKIICPLLWDVSVAGHIDAGETAEQAVIRETKEEIGLTIFESDLQKIGVFKCFQSYDNGIVDNEFHHTYLAELKIPIEELKPQELEVENLKLVSLDKFKELIVTVGYNNNHFVPSNKGYYQIILQHITNILFLSLIHI